MNLIQRDEGLFSKYKENNYGQEYEQWLESQLKEVKEENRHLSIYATHTQYCACGNHGYGICDCGYIKNQN